MGGKPRALAQGELSLSESHVGYTLIQRRGDTPVNTDLELLEPPLAAASPSADFIHAVSEFLDTDPKDLLTELGYYAREADSAKPDAPFVSQ
jgi:hypothetical protein